jgi:hypothetical protein
LRKFWVDHREVLPVHYAVYLAEVACLKAASANVESVFSGAGKFTKEAPSTGHVLLKRIVRLHYNWKYDFIRPSIKAVCARYMEKFHAAPCAAASDEPSASAAAAAPDAAPPTPTPEA